MTSAALASFSLTAIYSAMGVYLFAFIAFTLDLAKRSA
ncbi:MAG: c-type cytochrome biogenesis protein CcsB, partial [Candidatus Saccharibacteria bacterium]|nr:c-type cytochrome biogenesis protein CcsB [Microbacteriaceae bacterium]